MTKIDRQLLNDLRPDMEEMLQPLAEKHGINIEIGSGRYGGLTGHLKVELSTTNEEGDDERAVQYKQYAENHGLRKEWLGKSFKIRGESFTVIGLDLKKRKNIVILRRDRDGVEMKAPERTVTHGMKMGGM